MKKTTLEKRVTDIAKDRLDQEYEKAINSLHNNIFLKNLKIDGKHFFIRSHPSASIFFDKKQTNIDEVKKDLLAKIEAEVLSEILEGIEKSEEKKKILTLGKNLK